jgi:NADH:ubiquinone oxidoreductase subunit C
MIKGWTRMGLDSFKPHPTINDLFVYILSLFPSKFLFISTKNTIFDFYIMSKDIFSALSFLKLNQLLQYKTLVDIAVVDNPFKLNRFKLVYTLLSYNFNQRANIHTYVKEADFVVSVRPVFRAAN